MFQTQKRDKGFIRAKGEKMKLANFDFRIWDKGEGTLTWKLGINFSNPQQDYGETESVLHAYYDGEPLCPDDCEIELWTGLVDVNGVKLYDGDIFIVFGDEKYRAVCNIREFYGKPLSERNVKLPLNIINPKKPKEWKLEVIGNIHESKEQDDD